MPKVLFEDTISDTPCRIVLADDATLQCEQASARDAMGSVIWRGIDSHNAQILKSRCILHLYRQHGGTKPDSEDKPAVNSDEILSLLKRHFLSGRRAAPVAALVDGGVDCPGCCGHGLQHDSFGKHAVSNVRMQATGFHEVHIRAQEVFEIGQQPSEVE